MLNIHIYVALTYIHQFHAAVCLLQVEFPDRTNGAAKRVVENEIRAQNAQYCATFLSQYYHQADRKALIPPDCDLSPEEERVSSHRCCLKTRSTQGYSVGARSPTASESKPQLLRTPLPTMLLSG
mmetsp:Transcript_35085/g.54827  ORF Transcript_35085/g.54827 Transcript_35085/m.54827 type:complete len:125 (-) Transcript_35085:603-977(-)